jgi:hypothetical protein
MGMTLDAANGSFTVSGAGKTVYRGTYTVSGNDVIITFKSINTGFLSGGNDEWTAYDDIDPEEIEGVPPAKTMNGTISGNTLSVEGQTFTKQGVSTPGGSTPGGSTPGGNTPGGGGGGGTFTLTGIPATYNGKYAILAASNEAETVQLIGCQNINMSTQVITASPITSGSVQIPMWTATSQTSVQRYSGNDTVGLQFMIFNSANITAGQQSMNPTATRIFYQVAFSSGSATKTWNEGDEAGQSGGGEDYDLTP